MPKIVNGYVMMDEGKMRRARNEAGAMADDATILAHYDKHAGLISKDGYKVATGAFWDFENKKVREVVVEKPEVVTEPAPKPQKVAAPARRRRSAS